MVRTYSFNPSTQSHLDSSMLPSLLLHSAHPPHHHHQHHPKDPGPTPLTEPNWTISQQRGGLTSLDSLASGASSLSIGSSSISSQNQPVSIEEERTTVLGIRSVLINGQRFFQPVEINNQNGQSAQDNPSNNVFAIALAQSGNGQTSNKANPQPIVHLQNPQKQLNAIPYSNQTETIRQAEPKPSGHLLVQTLSKPMVTPHSHDEESEVLPWARGNPQPKSGQRGSRQWKEAQQRGQNGFDSSFGSSSTLSWAGDSQRAEQERHRVELLRQIEENKTRKMRERQMEWEQEERQRVRDELWSQRQRMEMEEEKRKEREKALLAELKAAKLAAAQRATEEAIREAQRGEQRGGRRERRGDLDGWGEEEGRGERAVEEGLEWWERKDRRRAQQQSERHRAQSPAIPTVQRQIGENGRSLSVGSRNGRGSGGGGRLAYSPSVASRGRTPVNGSDAKERPSAGGRQFGREKQKIRDRHQFDV